ncbi:MAG: phosphoribosylanthranilate isomerase [Polyangiales bacterium]
METTASEALPSRKPAGAIGEVEVKICGITSLADAEMCVRAGADALGLNFWRPGKRYCTPDAATRIASALGDAVELVGVFVDASCAEIEAIRAQTGIAWVQAHGHEPAELLRALLPYAYKAVAVQSATDIARARAYPGTRLLLDAYSPAVPGGSGQCFAWPLATELARERELILAGGLRPDNVAEAIRVVQPARVDVASGVESSPGRKDAGLVRDFVAAVQAAAR